VCAGEDKHLPVHGTIVYVPLIDLEPIMGSVEFAFGTHVNHENEITTAVSEYQAATNNDDPWSPGTDKKAIKAPKGVKSPMPTAGGYPRRGELSYYSYYSYYQACLSEGVGC
jgi:hypothetical protein